MRLRQKEGRLEAAPTETLDVSLLSTIRHSKNLSIGVSDMRPPADAYAEVSASLTPQL
jgi:hypothetical protein